MSTPNPAFRDMEEERCWETIDRRSLVIKGLKVPSVISRHVDGGIPQIDDLEKIWFLCYPTHNPLKFTHSTTRRALKMRRQKTPRKKGQKAPIFACLQIRLIARPCCTLPSWTTKKPFPRLPASTWSITRLLRHFYKSGRKVFEGWYLSGVFHTCT